MSRTIRRLVAMLLVMVSLGVCTAVDAESSAAPAVRVIRFTMRMEISNPSPDPVRDMRIVVPPRVMNRSGTQRVIGVAYSPEPQTTEQTPAGDTATYVIPLLNPGEGLTIQQVYTVELTNAASSIPADRADPLYLQPEPGVESDNPAIAAAAADVAGALTDVTGKVQAIMQYVGTHIAYDAASPAADQGALAGFESGRGVCQEYASLFVAMARAQGVPARLVYGWGGVDRYDGALNGLPDHAWAEYFDPERGWVQVDPTFTRALPAELVLGFSGRNHLAQNWAINTIGLSFSDWGLPSMKTTYEMSAVN